jgi:putative membrane protein
MMRDHGLWMGLVILILVVLVAPMLVGGMVGPGVAMGPGMMWGYAPQGFPPWMTGWRWGLGLGLGWLAMLAFWGALVAGVVLLVRALKRVGSEGKPEEPGEALAILQRRYAAGEITKEEYERIRKDLAA